MRPNKCLRAKSEITIQSEAISPQETFRPIRAVAVGYALRLIARQEIFGDADTIAHTYNLFN
jgi:hypothetical protein